METVERIIHEISTPVLQTVTFEDQTDNVIHEFRANDSMHIMKFVIGEWSLEYTNSNPINIINKILESRHENLLRNLNIIHSSEEPLREINPQVLMVLSDRDINNALLMSRERSENANLAIINLQNLANFKIASLTSGSESVYSVTEEDCKKIVACFKDHYYQNDNPIKENIIKTYFINFLNFLFKPFIDIYTYRNMCHNNSKPSYIPDYEWENLNPLEKEYITRKNKR